MQPQKPTARAALALLGLADGADRDAVTQAYRRLARTTHPDLSDAADAAARFDALTAAYRRALDAAPPAGGSAPPGPEVVYRHLPPLVVPLATAGPCRPVIIAGPGRVDPLPTRRTRP